MSPAGDVRPGWRIVLDAFLAAPNYTLTNHELGDIRGVQAFRSRISDLRRMGCTITPGEYVRQGCYAYRLVSWPPTLLGQAPAPAAPAPSAVAAAQDAAAEAPQAFPVDMPDELPARPSAYSTFD